MGVSSEREIWGRQNLPDSGNLKQTLGYPQVKLQESQLKISML